MIPNKISGFLFRCIRGAIHIHLATLNVIFTLVGGWVNKASRYLLQYTFSFLLFSPVLLNFVYQNIVFEKLFHCFKIRKSRPLVNMFLRSLCIASKTKHFHSFLFLFYIVGNSSKPLASILFHHGLY